MQTQNSNKKNPNQKIKPPKFNVMWIYLPLLGMIAYMYFVGYNGGDPLKTEWYKVKEEMIAQGDVEKVKFITNAHKAEVTIKQDSLKKYKNLFGGREPKYAPHFYFIVSDNFDSETQLEEARALLPAEKRFEIETEEKTNYFRIIDWLIFPLLILALWFFMIRRMSKGMGSGPGGGGIFNVGKSQAKLFDKENNTKVTFKDVAGLEEAKVEIMEIVDFLKKADKYKALGAKIPKGALLVGPPGTGKTLLAKAVAGEANVPFLSISGSDFVEMFVGVGASRVRDLFEQAKKVAPCIVFIDEIDAIGRARGKNSGFSGNDERENTLNQLLTEMDGFQTNAGVIVLAATNRVDILDKALMRAGRFDRQIEVGLPDVKERQAIFEVHLKKLKLDDKLDREFLAKQTPGFAGADIANVCNEAALIAARGNKSAVTQEDFLAAIDRIVGGLERRNMPMSPAERRSTAIHEAGHATVMWRLKNCDPVLKITIIPRGRSLGATWYLPEERANHNVEHFMHKMAGLLGGRIAEQMLMNITSTGAINDLERTSKTAYAMVAYYGMSPAVGNISFYDASGQRDMFTKPFSERTAELIDSEVRRLVDEAVEITRNIIDKERENIERLADLLIAKETIFTEDIESILGKSAQQIAREELEVAEAATKAMQEPASEIDDTEDVDITYEVVPTSAEEAEVQGDGKTDEI